MKNIILLLSIISTVSCCTNQKNKDDTEIRTVVKKYFSTIENNDLNGFSKLISNSDKFPGGISSYLFFLNNNYSKINPDNILLKNIKIKDTFDIGEHQKYILFVLKKPKPKPFETNQDLRMYLFFRKAVGYDKISEIFIIGNIPDWEDQKPMDLYK